MSGVRGFKTGITKRLKIFNYVEHHLNCSNPISYFTYYLKFPYLCCYATSIMIQLNLPGGKAKCFDCEGPCRGTVRFSCLVPKK